MKRRVLQIAAIAFFAVSAALGADAPPLVALQFDPPEQASELSVTRTILARILPEAPVIDGSLEEEAWSSASPLGAFLNVGTNRPAKPETRVWVGHFKETLYVGVQCVEPETARRASEADAIEVLLCFANDRKTLQDVGVSASGTLQADQGIGAAVARSGSGWTVELAVPHSGESDIIGFNVVRRRPGTEGEPFTWNPAPAEFEDGRWLGNLSFERFPCSIQKVEVGWPHTGANRIRVWVRNSADRGLWVRAGLATRRRRGEPDRSQYRFSAPAGQTIECAFLHRISEAGACDMDFLLMDDEHERPLTRFLRPGLDVGASAVVLGKLEGSGDRRQARFRILLPFQELADATFNVTVRDPATYQAIGSASERKLTSREGFVRVNPDALAKGEYQLHAYVMREGEMLGRAVQDFSVR